MKAKSILKLRDRLGDVTTETRFSEEGNAELTVRFDPWEELIYINEMTDKHPEIRLSLKEAQKLKSLLNKLI